MATWPVTCMTAWGLPREQLAKEIAGFPRRSLALLGDVVSHEKDHLHVLDRGIEVQRLTHVVAGRVIPLLDPVLDELSSVRARVLGLESFADGDSGDPLPYKGIVVSANKTELFRHGIRADLQTEFGRDPA